MKVTMSVASEVLTGRYFRAPLMSNRKPPLAIAFREW